MPNLNAIRLDSIIRVIDNQVFVIYVNKVNQNHNNISIQRYNIILEQFSIIND